MYNRLRRVFYPAYITAFTSRKRPEAQFPESWTCLLPKHRKELVAFWGTKAGDSERQAGLDWAAEHVVGKAADAKAKKWSRAKQLLLTYQGDFGTYLKDGATAAMSVDDVVAVVQASTFFERLWSQIQDVVAAIATKVHATDHAVCAEICVKTLLDKKETRVHSHVCLRAPQSMDIRHREDLLLMGCLPHVCEDARVGKRARRTDWGPFYYCLAPKIGSLARSGSKQPHQEFSVNANWIWGMLATGKIAFDDARRELIRTAKNLPRTLESFERYRSELSGLELREGMAAREEELKAARRPFRQIPEVVAWQAEHAAVSSRKKFLVLNGRSRTGKTVFAVSLVGRGRALELNCSGALDPPLRDFQHDLHDLVLFDEASPKMVLKYKKLFQCPNALVQIGFSATNVFSYSVYMHRCLLVIASNT